MRSSRNLKETQSFIRRLAALSRFISKATDKCQPFFQVIRRVKKTEWTPECEEVPEFEAIFTASTSVVHAAGWGHVVPVCGGIGSYHKFCSSERGRRGSVSDILHQQGLA